MFAAGVFVCKRRKIICKPARLLADGKGALADYCFQGAVLLSFLMKIKIYEIVYGNYGAAFFYNGCAGAKSKLEKNTAIQAR
jgi:hypothetical protein